MSNNYYLILFTYVVVVVLYLHSGKPPRITLGRSLCHCRSFLGFFLCPITITCPPHSATNSWFWAALTTKWLHNLAALITLFFFCFCFWFSHYYHGLFFVLSIRMILCCFAKWMWFEWILLVTMEFFFLFLLVFFRALLYKKYFHSKNTYACDICYCYFYFCGMKNFGSLCVCVSVVNNSKCLISWMNEKFLAKIWNSFLSLWFSFNFIFKIFFFVFHFEFHLLKWMQSIFSLSLFRSMGVWF